MSEWRTYVCATCFMLGIVSADLSHSWWVFVLLTMFGGFTLFGCVLVRIQKSFILEIVGYTAITLLACSLCLAKWQSYEDSRNGLSLGRVDIVGKIVKEPDRRDNGTWYVLDVGVTRVRVFAPNYPAYMYGETLRLAGEVELPQPFSDDAGTPFDYPMYLATQGITHVSFRPKLSLVSETTSHSMVATLIEAKSAMALSIARGIESPQADLVIGMLLGIKRSLGDEILQAMQKVGLVHLVVLSGFNVSIIILVMKSSVSSLPVAARITCMSILVTAFVLMIGASASVTRAAAMAMTGYIAESLSRRYSPMRALIFAAAIMAAHNPLIVLHDPGFQLSFLATAGVITISTPIKRWCFGVPERFGMRDAVAQTLSAQLMTLPVIMSMTGSVSVWSVFANALVVPMVTQIMLFGALTLATGFISPWLQLPFATIASLCASSVLYIVEFFARL